MTQLTRLNVNLNAETADALKAVAESKGITVTEAVRRSVAVYAFLMEEEKQGRHVQTATRKGKKVRELVLS